MKRISKSKGLKKQVAKIKGYSSTFVVVLALISVVILNCGCTNPFTVHTNDGLYYGRGFLIYNWIVDGNNVTVLLGSTPTNRRPGKQTESGFETDDGDLFQFVRSNDGELIVPVFPMSSLVRVSERTDLTSEEIDVLIKAARSTEIRKANERHDVKEKTVN